MEISPSPLSIDLFNFSKEGYYGQYGGSFVPEILQTTVEELTTHFKKFKQNPENWKDYIELSQNYCGRSTPLTHLKNLSKHLGGSQIYLKREDLNHTGSHKINNVMGQGLLVKAMNKKRVIAETGAGQHGVATATMAAKFGYQCTIYMGAVDIARQRPNVFWMEQMGAEVIAVESGQKTLKDAIAEAMRDWSSSMENTHYVLGTACGPHPFPEIVCYFQQIIGIEAKKQILERTGKLPDYVYACVGGGSNALGLFQAFLNEDTKMVGIEAAGKGLHTKEHASRLTKGSHASIGVVDGYKTEFLQDDEGQVLPTHSVAAGLDYMGISPILAHLHKEGRIDHKGATDSEVLEAEKLLMKHEGIIPALESAHALAGVIRKAKTLSPSQTILSNLSGRGDKDIFTIANALDDNKWKEYLTSQI